MGQHMRMAVCGISPKSFHFRTYVNHLAAQGHDVTVITNADEFDAPVEVVNFARVTRVSRMMPPRMGWILRAWRLWRALHGHGFDVVNIQQMTPDGVIATMLSAVPVVPTFWGSDILRLGERPRWVRLLMPRAVRKSSALHATAHVIAGRLIDLGADPGRIAVFNYGVDLGLFRLRTAEPERGSIVSTRHLQPLYRHADIIRAMPLVLEREPDARLTLAGLAPEEDLDMLTGIVGQLGLSGVVEFPGRLDKPEVARRLAAAELWVSIPTSDSLAISLQEAMACGAFPVVSDLPSMREILDEPNAVFVRDVSPAALADSVVRALSLARTGAHVAVNRATVERVGDRSHNLHRYERLLVEAASSLPGSPPRSPLAAAYGVLTRRLAPYPRRTGQGRRTDSRRSG